ncbi:MAG: TolC family protein [Microscillaceae bacterium]|nr:TolC family protein [Microscillaceae bacterium]MDW8459749.1 TolC family protein [Cytophagales bacterium]
MIKRKFFSLIVLGVMVLELYHYGHAQRVGEVFSLQQCIEYAIQNNLQVKQNALQALVAQNNATQAKLNRLPNLNVGASQNFSLGYAIDPFTNQFVDQQISSNNFSINSSITLFNGFQVQNNIKRTTLDAQIAKLNVEQTKNDIALNVAQLYVQILLNKELVEAAKQQVEITKAQLERTEKLFKVGALPEINVIELKSQLANNELAVVTAENQLTLSKVQLQQALNLPISETFDIQNIEIGEIEATPYPQSPAQIFQTAETFLPNIKAADLTIRSRDVSIAIAKGGRFPRLTLNAGSTTGYSSARTLSEFSQTLVTQQIGFLTNNPSETVSAVVPVTTRRTKDYPFSQQFYDNRSYFAGLSLNIPIFNAGQVRNNIKNAIVQKEIAEIQAKQIRLQVRQAIEQAHTEVRTAANTYYARKQQVQNLQASFEVTEKRYNAGAANVVDYNIAKLNLDRAKIDLIRAKYDYILRKKILDFYQGNSLEFK